MTHNVAAWGVCGTLGGQVVHTERMHTHVPYITEHILSDEKAYTYARSEGGSASRGRVIHNLRNNNVERPVQAALRGAQPLDANVMLAPSFLEAVAVPGIDRIEIEGAAVTEVQSRPSHVCFGRAHTLFGQAKRITPMKPYYEDGAVQIFHGDCVADSQRLAPLLHQRLRTYVSQPPVPATAPAEDEG